MYLKHCATYADIVGSHLAVNRIRLICTRYKSNEVSSISITSGRARSEQRATESEVLVEALQMYTASQKNVFLSFL